MKKKYTEYDIHGKGVPKLQEEEVLKEYLSRFATKKAYDSFDKLKKSGIPDSNNPHPVNSQLTQIGVGTQLELLPILERCFPSLRFRISGNFVYGPGDFIDEHTNSDDASYVMYITYATGVSSFSYRFSLDEEKIKTYDTINNLTIRTFYSDIQTPTYHQVDCESGYRVSIGLRYAEI